MNNARLPLLIAWAAKGLILRYGGVRLYRQGLPLFLGLILGQMVAGSAWHLIGHCQINPPMPCGHPLG